jgi:hypothetical protein
MPFAAETWASQKSDLPLYAEAAPDLFLDIVEQDLQIDDPKILSLLRKSRFPETDAVTSIRRFLSLVTAPSLPFVITHARVLGRHDPS